MTLRNFYTCAVVVTMPHSLKFIFDWAFASHYEYLMGNLGLRKNLVIVPLKINRIILQT